MLISIWEDGKLNNIVIAKENTVTLKSIDVSSEKAIDKEPNLPSLNWIERPYHQIKYEWINIAPATKTINEA